MCGICGSTRKAALDPILSAMVHRGPDDNGVFTDIESGVSLGARRLSIIDVAGGHQPLCNPEGTVWAVLNGEIYNYPALRRDLLRRGHTLSSRTDTEVLVHLYEEYSDDLVHALDGMFAFAVWDTRRQHLLLARDRFGEKPLFYAEREGNLAFASELTALRAGTDDAWTLDPRAIDSVFRLGYVVQPQSMVHEARQLPPAHRLTWDYATRSVQLERYWRLAEFPERSESSRRDLIDETHRLLRESVSSRLTSDVPLGVLLSGGVDSSLIAALAAEVSTEPVRTFTVGYSTGIVDETRAARQVARVLGTKHTEAKLSSEEVAARLPGVLRRLDQPIADQALIALHTIAETARAAVTVGLGGEGADELFGGYPRFRWLERAERLHRVLPDAAASPLGAALAALPLSGRLNRLATVVEPLTPMERQLRWVVGDRQTTAQSLYGPRLRDAYAVPLGLELPAQAAQHPAAAFMALDRDVWLVDDVLAKADRASMLASFELRNPMLSRALAEFSVSVPTSVHLRGGGKGLLRDVLRRFLPAAVQPRRKIAFRVPAADWLRGPLRETMAELIETNRLFADGWFDRPATSRLLAEHIDGSRDNSWSLWPVLSLGLWLEGFQAS